MKIAQLSLIAVFSFSLAACNKPASNPAPAASNAAPANTAPASAAPSDPNATIPPRLLSGVNAPFPNTLWDKPGRVTVAAVVGVDGKVAETKIVSSPHPELNDLAANAVKQWKFEPAKKAGQAVPFTITVNIDFAPPKPGQKVPVADTSADKAKK